MSVDLGVFESTTALNLFALISFKRLDFTPISKQTPKLDFMLNDLRHRRFWLIKKRVDPLLTSP